jgi:Fic family protein
MGTYVETTTDMEFMNSLARQVDDNFVDFTAQYSEDAALLLESAKDYYNSYEACIINCSAEGHDVTSHQANLTTIENWITGTLSGSVETINTSVEITNLAPTA